MSTPQYFALRSFAASAVMALAACGGGDDSNGSVDPNSGAKKDGIDKYVGTYTETCAKNPQVTDSTTNAPLYQTFTLTIGKKTSATSAPVTASYTFHDGENCTGTLRATLTSQGKDNQFILEGSETVGGKQVEKVLGTFDPFFPGISAKAIILNGVKFSDPALLANTVQTSKQIWLLDSSNNLYFGNTDQPLDSSGYPSVLGTTSLMKKG